MTTLGYLVLDPEHERVDRRQRRPPAAAPRRRRTARRVPAGGDATSPLGVSRGARYREHTFALPARARRVLLFTDGASRCAASRSTRASSACARLAEREHRRRGALRRRSPRGDAPPAPRRTTTWRCSPRASTPLPRPAHARAGRPTPDALAACARCCAAGCAPAAPPDDEIYDITVAVQEASANAVEHAYAPGSARFEVEAHADGRRSPSSCATAAAGAAPRGTHRGRGMPMMRALMETRRRRAHRRRDRPSSCAGRWGRAHEPLARVTRRVARRRAGRARRGRDRRLQRRRGRRPRCARCHQPARRARSST